MNQLIQPNRTLPLLLFISMCSSAFVLFEPAPYEIFILCCMLFSLYSNKHLYEHIHFLPTLLLIIFILLTTVSMLFAEVMSASIMYYTITLYLACSWLFIAGICSFYELRILPYFLYGYTVAAVLSVIISIISFQFEIYVDIFQQFGRIKGFFKDPNVFGPFLIPPALFMLWLVIEIGLKKVRGWSFLFLFLLLSIGVLLSFSRAAWGNYVLTLTFFFLFLKIRPIKIIKILLVVIVIAIPLLLYTLTSTESAELFKDRTSLQHYDEQRFSNQEAAANYIALFPLGTGPGQSELELDIATHSIFVRILYENGLISLIVFLCFYLLCLARSIKAIIHLNDYTQGYFAIIAACLIGILFNSFFIDTIHWRHVWFLLALPFMYRGG